LINVFFIAFYGKRVRGTEGGVHPSLHNFYKKFFRFQKKFTKKFSNEKKLKKFKNLKN